MRIVSTPGPSTFTLRATCGGCGTVADAELQDIVFVDRQNYQGGAVVQYICPGGGCGRLVVVPASEVPRALWRRIEGHG